MTVQFSTEMVLLDVIWILKSCLDFGRGKRCTAGNWDGDDDDIKRDNMRIKKRVFWARSRLLFSP
jgi:hypothetical protein